MTSWQEAEFVARFSKPQWHQCPQQPCCSIPSRCCVATAGPWWKVQVESRDVARDAALCLQHTHTPLKGTESCHKSLGTWELARAPAIHLPWRPQAGPCPSQYKGCPHIGRSTGRCKGESVQHRGFQHLLGAQPCCRRHPRASTQVTPFGRGARGGHWGRA